MTKPEHGTLSHKDLERLLSSIKVDARKIREAVERMDADRERLEAGGQEATALVLDEACTTIRVGLRHLSDVFKVSL